LGYYSDMVPYIYPGIEDLFNQFAPASGWRET
jgi:hypothetical protein